MCPWDRKWSPWEVHWNQPQNNHFLLAVWPAQPTASTDWMMKEILERKTPNNLKRTECGMGWYWSSHTDHRSASSVGWWGSGSWHNKKIRERTAALLPVLGAPVVIKIAPWFPGSQIWPVRVGASLRGTPPPVLGLLTGLPAPLMQWFWKCGLWISGSPCYTFTGSVRSKLFS